MKNSNILVLGALAAGVGYWMFFRRQAMDPATGLAYPQNYNPGQPQQSYPWQATQSPRVDNANQPWYNGDRSSMVGPAENTLNDFAMNLKAGGSVIHSVKDIWGDLTSIFDSADPQRDLVGDISFLNSESFGADIAENTADFGDDWGSFDTQYGEQAIA